MGTQGLLPSQPASGQSAHSENQACPEHQAPLSFSHPQAHSLSHALWNSWNRSQDCQTHSASPAGRWGSGVRPPTPTSRAFHRLLTAAQPLRCANHQLTFQIDLFTFFHFSHFKHLIPAFHASMAQHRRKKPTYNTGPRALQKSLGIWVLVSRLVNGAASLELQNRAEAKVRCDRPPGKRVPLEQGSRGPDHLCYANPL